jgi:hypothetical protein
VWNIHIREISTEKMNDLHWLLDKDAELGYRARMVLLRDEGYTVPEIRRITNHHDNNIRKWIHRFNEKGIDGINYPRIVLVSQPTRSPHPNLIEVR